MNKQIFKKFGLGLLLVVVVLALGTALALRSNQNPATLADGQDQGSSQLALVKDNVVSALAVSRAQAASVTIDLCASDGTITLPGPVTVPVWGFVDTDSAPCTTGLVTSLPGPEIRVNHDDIVTISLTNALSEPVSILIPGQNLVATGGSAGTFTAEAAASGGTASYEFTAQEGSYLYESGTDAERQVAMGLFGALVVESGVGGVAYGQLIDQDPVLVLSEIDPILNANPAGFNLQDFHPTYWLINGKAYDPANPAANNISVNDGEKVLLRYLNAGFLNPSMALLGAYQQVIAKNGFALFNPFEVVVEIVPAGQTADMLVDTTGLGGSLLALYNRNARMTNGAAFPGGMLTYLDVQGTIGNPPTISFANPMNNDTVSGTVTVQINASDTEDDASPGPGSLTVEWRVVGALTWETTSWDGSQYVDSWITTVLGEGDLTLEAQVTDSHGNLTSTSVTVTVDNVDDPPVVSIISPQADDLLTGSITIEASASDDRGITQVEFFDGATSLGVDSDDSDGWSFDWITIPADDGAHSLTAEATDNATPTQNMTTSGIIGVTVDNTDPTVSITAPTGGTVSGLVNITAYADDGLLGSGVVQVEFFVNGESIGVDAFEAGGWSAEWETSDLNEGPYSLTATATDGVALSTTSSPAVVVTVENPDQNTMHVGDLNAKVKVKKHGQDDENWTATVTIFIHDETHANLEGADVTMQVSWIIKAGGTGTDNLMCTTSDKGKCQVSKQFLSADVEDIVTFTVMNVENALTYDDGENHDPDPDPGEDVTDNKFSDGTTIEVEGHRP